MIRRGEAIREIRVAEKDKPKRNDRPGKTNEEEKNDRRRMPALCTRNKRLTTRVSMDLA